jgi:hypothetical protein
MKFPIYGKVKNVPNHQPAAGLKKKSGYQLSKLWVIGLGLSLCSLSGAKILANLGLLDILIKGWQKRKTSPNFLE